MNLSPQYKDLMTQLLAAASELFYAGQDPSGVGLKVSKKVNIEGTGLDGQQHLDFDKGKCYVQISEAVVEMGQQISLLTSFAIAHELGHICVSEISANIGTDTLLMSSLKHEVAADLVGTSLLLKINTIPRSLVDLLKTYGDFVMDENQHGTHPARSDRIGYITSFIIKTRISQIGTVDAIRQILEAMGNV